MNEKTNDEVENNNSMAQQENVGEKLDQEKDQENKILAAEDSVQKIMKIMKASEESSSENNEAVQKIESK